MLSNLPLAHFSLVLTALFLQDPSQCISHFLVDPRATLNHTTRVIRMRDVEVDECFFLLDGRVLF